jgi:hypothetical protein
MDSYYNLDAYYPLPAVIIPNYVEYEDLNYSSELRGQMIKYFYEKVNSWLHDGFSDLLKYFRPKGDSAGLVDRMEDAKEREVSEKDREKIIEYIYRDLVTKHSIEKDLSQFIRRTHTNWYDLKYYKEYVKEYLHHELKKRIKEKIYDKSSKK